MFHRRKHRFRTRSRNELSRRRERSSQQPEAVRGRRLNRRSAVVLSAVLLAVVSIGAAPAAASDWGWGTSFRIGGLSFRIGHAPHHAGHYDHYYYRVGAPIESRYRCSDRCYVQRGSYYHHRDCPALRSHLGRSGYDYVRVFDRYAPYYAP